MLGNKIGKDGEVEKVPKRQTFGSYWLELAIKSRTFLGLTNYNCYFGSKFLIQDKVLFKYRQLNWHTDNGKVGLVRDKQLDSKGIKEEQLMCF